MEIYFKRESEVLAYAYGCKTRIEANACPTWYQALGEHGQSVTISRSAAIDAGVVGARPIETVAVGSFF